MATTNLATLSLSARKPKKPEAKEHLRDIYERHPEEAAALAELYNYFMPAPPKNPKTAWDWVARAASDPKKDARNYLQYVHVTEDRIEATNGERMHIYYTDTREGGYSAEFYRPNADPVEDPTDYPTDYPDTNRVIVARSEDEHRIPLADFQFDIRELDIRNAYTITAQNGETVGINCRYLDDALKAGIGEPVIQRPADEGSAIRVDDGPCVAIIMPIRL